MLLERKRKSICVRINLCVQLLLKLRLLNYKTVTSHLFYIIVFLGTMNDLFYYMFKRSWVFIHVNSERYSRKHIIITYFNRRDGYITIFNNSKHIYIYIYIYIYILYIYIIYIYIYIYISLILIIINFKRYVFGNIFVYMLYC